MLGNPSMLSSIASSLIKTMTESFSAMLYAVDGIPLYITSLLPSDTEDELHPQKTKTIRKTTIWNDLVICSELCR